MRIIDFIRVDRIAADMRAVDKEGALGELADLLRGEGGVDRAAVLDAWIERERLASTGIGDGVAIPHGKLRTANGLVAALGRSRKGVEFGSMDGKPAHLFFALVAPENSAGLHLKALARISRLLKDSDFRARLLDAEGAEDLFQIVGEEDAKY
jgi:nitrogen PTS system EIIA component